MKKNQNETVTDTEVEKTQVEIENELLKSQLEEMKKMIQELSDNPKQQQYQQENNLYVDELQNQIPPNKMIPIISMRTGGLNLHGVNGKLIYLEDFGKTRSVAFEDLMHIHNSMPNVVEEGWFIIQNADAVKTMYLDDKYEKFVSKKILEDIINLPVDEITNTLKGLNESMRTTAVEIIIRGIAARENKFSDLNKIQAISDYIGQDINELAKSR